MRKYLICKKKPPESVLPLITGFRKCNWLFEHYQLVVNVVADFTGEVEEVSRGEKVSSKQRR
jgi:hypothetical protein